MVFPKLALILSAMSGLSGIQRLLADRDVVDVDKADLTCLDVLFLDLTGRFQRKALAPRSLKVGEFDENDFSILLPLHR